jgi:hypothetical protein
MVKMTVAMKERDLKLIKQLALREGRSQANTCQMLISMSLEMIGSGKVPGLCYQSIPLIPPELKHESKTKPADWTKEQRDNWILTGEGPPEVA